MCVHCVQQIKLLYQSEHNCKIVYTHSAGELHKDTHEGQQNMSRWSHFLLVSSISVHNSLISCNSESSYILHGHLDY